MLVVARKCAAHPHRPAACRERPDGPAAVEAVRDKRSRGIWRRRRQAIGLVKEMLGKDLPRGEIRIVAGRHQGHLRGLPADSARPAESVGNGFRGVGRLIGADAIEPELVQQRGTAATTWRRSSRRSLGRGRAVGPVLLGFVLRICGRRLSCRPAPQGLEQRLLKPVGGLPAVNLRAGSVALAPEPQHAPLHLGAVQASLPELSFLGDDNGASDFGCEAAWPERSSPVRRARSGNRKSRGTS